MNFRILNRIFVILLFANISLAQDSLGVRALGKIDFPSWENAYSISLSDNYAYVGTGGQGLTVVDVSDPQALAEVWHCDTIIAQDVALSGDLAYVAKCFNWFTNFSYLTVLNIANPARPVHLSTTTMFGVSAAITTVGTTVYMISDGLKIFDASNPRHPVLRGTFDDYDDDVTYATDVKVAGNYAYIADTGGMRVVDISNPAQPREASYFHTNMIARNVALSGNIAYLLVEERGLYSIDISNPTNPRELYLYEIQGAWQVSVGEMAYVAGGDAGLIILDISNPNQISEIGSLQEAEFAYDVVGNQDFAFVASGSRGLISVDLENPAQPTFAGRCGAVQMAISVEVHDNIAYIANFYGGMCIIDFIDHAHPIEIGRWYLRSRVADVTVKDNYAYVADFDSGLAVIDLDDLSNPREANYLESAWLSSRLVIAGNLLAAADQMTGVYIYNIEDPVNPVEVSFFQKRNANDITIVGDILYVAVFNGGLSIVSLADPNNPEELGFYDSPGEAVTVGASQGYAYLGDGSGGLRIIDVRDPANPQEVGHEGTPAYAGKLAFANNYVFVTDYNFGIYIINVSRPDSPNISGFYHFVSAINDISLVGRLACTTDYRSFRIYNCSGALSVDGESQINLTPGEFDVSAYPNPFNSSTTISYSLPKPGRYALDVIDLQGRLVTRLSDGWREAGSYREVWQASQSSGCFVIRFHTDASWYERTIILQK